jgi:hypothetical protein
MDAQATLIQQPGKFRDARSDSWRLRDYSRCCAFGSQVQRVSSQISATNVRGQQLRSKGANGRQIFEILQVKAVAPEQGLSELRFPALAHEEWRHVDLLQQKSARLKLRLGARNHVRPAGFDSMQVNASGQRRKQGCALPSPPPQKIGHIAAGFQHQGSAKLAIERVFHHNIEHPDTVIHQDLQLFFGSLRSMLARENGTVPYGPRNWQPITLRG